MTKESCLGQNGRSVPAEPKARQGKANLVAMTLADFTEPKLLVPRLLSANQNGAIMELSKRLHRAGRIEDAEAFCQAVLERESLLHPVVEQGLAFPHARGRAVHRLSFAVGLSAAGIRWDSAKGMIVHAVVLLAVPLSEAQIYLALLGTLSRFTQDETAFASFKQSAQPEKMLAILNSFPLPESRSL